MRLDQEAGRRHVRHVAGAVVHVEHPLAAGALEMVVVRLARRLVAGAVAGQRHLLDLAGLDQQLQVAVDGGQAQAGHGRLRGGQHFLRRQRALCGVDGGADGAALAGGSFHGRPCATALHGTILRRQFHQDRPPVSRPAASATPAAHVHTHAHAHGSGHGDHHPPAPAAATPRARLPSLLMAGVGVRLLGVAGLLALLWLAVAWALGEPA